MDHRYIDDRSVAERYLDHSLLPWERVDFETHLVDCQECADRLLLAEMFEQSNGPGGRNGAGGHNGTGGPMPAVFPGKASARKLTPWGFFVMIIAAPALVVLVPSLWLLWLTR